MTNSPDLIARAKAFIAAIARGASADEIATFYAPDILQEEFPNRLLPNGATRDFAALRESNIKARQVITSQTYEIVNAVRTGDCVAIEAVWSGTLAIPLGSLKPGDAMHARFAQFFEFRDGLITRIRNYDCFDPW
jgi:ketosteroid isomerase-like protein